MSVINLEDRVREVEAAINSHDPERVLALMAEDAVWINPYGAFKGKAELKRYIDWTNTSVKDFTITPIGVGIMAKGNGAMAETVISGIVEEEPVSFSSLCAYEFDENNQVKVLKTVFDRLALAEQGTDSWLSKTIVHQVVKKMQEGLED